MAGAISTWFAKPEFDMLHRLGIINFMRGEDGTGMFDYVEKKDTDEIAATHYWKSLEHPVDFIRNTFDPVTKARWHKNRPYMVALHTRAATQGKIEEKNQHPFVFDSIIGMHNGTIHGDFKNRKKFDTDSETLYHNIHKHGLRSALKDIQENDAAFALVWFDLKTKELYFLRNDKRPLNYAMAYSDKTMFWSSEKAHIEMCALPSKLKVEPFKPYHLYTADLTSLATHKPIVLKEEHIKEAETKKKVYPSSLYTNWGDWSAYDEERTKEEYWIKLGSDKESTMFSIYDSPSDKWYSGYQYEKLAECRAKSSESNVVPFETKDAAEDLYAFGPSFRFHCTEAAYIEKLKSNCAICGYSSDVDEFVYWIDNTEYICDSCAQDISSQMTQHWVYTQMGFTLETINRIKDEYMADLDKEETAAKTTAIVKVN
jgi:predicted glutamine amidotransferase